MLSFESYLILGIFAILIISLIILMFTKGKYHFEYLKRINPDKFNKYGSFSGLYNSFEFFNIYRISLLFPFFTRNMKLEKESDVDQIVKKVTYYNRLIYLNIALFILFILVLIVFLADFSVEL